MFSKTELSFTPFYVLKMFCYCVLILLALDPILDFSMEKSLFSTDWPGVLLDPENRFGGIAEPPSKVFNRVFS